MLEFSDKVVGTVKVELPITEKDIENIIVTCFEGGSNYWMGLNDIPNWEEKPKNEPISTWATKMLLDGKTIEFYDIEDSTEIWQLTKDKLIRGILLNCKNRPHDCDLENGDATTCDCIMQFALFGEVVYG